MGPIIGHSAKTYSEQNKQVNDARQPNGVKSLESIGVEQNATTTAVSQLPHSLDGTVFSRSTGVSDAVPVTLDTVHPNRIETQAIPEIVASPISRDEMHLKAKTAVEQCLPVGADYNFWIQNGVNRAVVDRLFDELNITRKSSVQANSDMKTDENQHSSLKEHDTAEVPREMSASLQTPQPESLDPALERKDRIARLLAAKKGQSIASAKSSQAGSPAPDRMMRTENQQHKQDQVASKAKSELSQLDAASEKASTSIEVAKQPPTALPSITLPTPVREQSNSTGFAIPGLFMTSAEEMEIEAPTTDLEQSSKSNLQPSTDSLTLPKSLKRSAEPLPANLLPQNKRQASSSVSVPPPPLAQSSDSVPVPAQAHVEETLPSSLPPVRNAADDADKVRETAANPARSVLNQGKLKDRMAALKAQLLTKNARKQALQDGMPMLAAEVEKTRQNLQERNATLLAVRKDIEAKSAVLAGLRDQENNLLQEIARLDSQLADGENGQRQFSNELDQLDDQIQVNENESKASQNYVPVPSPGAFVSVTEPSVAAAPPIKPHRPDRDQEKSADSLAADSPAPQIENLKVPNFEDLRRSVTTEYNPEQADLDRQLQASQTPVPEDTMVDADSQDTSTSASFGSAADDAKPDELSPEDKQDPYVDSDDDRMSIDDGSESGSSGSASMSDSGSEDYEPALNQHGDQSHVEDEPEDYEPAEPDAYEPQIDAENDEYEPAEEVDIIVVDNAPDGLQQPDASVSFTPTADTTMSTAARPVVEDVTPIPSSPMLPTPTSQTSPSVRQPDTQLTVLQSSAAPDSPLVLAPLSDGGKPAMSRFVPYQSPLSNFKSFRFHPQFSDVVKNGFRSLTYSNNIDPKTPLCSAELEGRFCEDVKCVDQHFGSMALSGK